MRVAFDLDDTLLPTSGGFDTDPPERVILRWLVSERLRRGTAVLLRDLNAAGHDVWIYTSSLRSQWAIRLLFRAYGVSLGGIVNQDVHDRNVARSGEGRRPSKFPPAFGIDILVDDNEGVVTEGRDNGFQVICVAPSDDAWCERVREAVKLHDKAESAKQ